MKDKLKNRPKRCLKGENGLQNQTRALLLKNEFNFGNMREKLKNRPKTCLTDKNGV